MLHQYRYRLAEPGVRAELAFLFDGYTHDMWWFELADMAHKLCLTSLVVFLPFNAQMPFAMGPFASLQSIDCVPVCGTRQAL